jgi:hypothetical protein
MFASTQKVKSIIVSLGLLFAVVGLSGQAALAVVDDAKTAAKAVCEGLGSATDSDGNCKDPTGSASVGNTVASLINVLSLIVGVVAVIMIIIGGLQYVMSGGDSGKVGNSKNTILYAVIGLVVVALAQIIVKFTVQSATKTT